MFKRLFRSIFMNFSFLEINDDTYLTFPTEKIWKWKRFPIRFLPWTITEMFEIYEIFMRLSKRIIFISSKREGKERKQLKNVIKIHLKRLHTLTYLLQNRTFYLSIIQNPQFLWSIWWCVGGLTGSWRFLGSGLGRFSCGNLVKLWITLSELLEIPSWKIFAFKRGENSSILNRKL